MDQQRSNELALRALELLKKDDLKMGDAWKEAHEICQAHEGVQVHDRLHALCHRIEGDFGNAAYWDRRGNQETPTGDLASEWSDLFKSVSQ